MAKSISTNFSLRIADKSKPVLVADKQVASALSGENFYAVTVRVDAVGFYLGEVNEFLAVQCKRPLLIDFQRVDMPHPNQIYCDSLFINHGDLGTVWLRVPPNTDPVVATLWYNSDVLNIPQDEFVQVYKAGIKTRMLLELRNLSGRELGIPIAKKNVFVGLRKTDGVLQAIKHNGVVSDLPIVKN